MKSVLVIAADELVGGLVKKILKDDFIVLQSTVLGQVEPAFHLCKESGELVLIIVGGGIVRENGTDAVRPVLAAMRKDYAGPIFFATGDSFNNHSLALEEGKNGFAMESVSEFGPKIQELVKAK